MDTRSSYVLPAARQGGLVVSEIDGQLVVYDLDSHHIHRLNGVSSAIWTALDGNRTVEDVAARASARAGIKIDDAAVQEALNGLSAANLLAGTVATERRGSRRFSRRAAVAGAVAIPAIVSMTATTAAGTTSQESCPPNGVNGSNGCMTAALGTPCCNDDVLVGICVRDDGQDTNTCTG
jgi:hypothetical protein